jgi:serine/threonine-protein kinase
VVAYECLTGTPPFTAETPVAIAVAHMHRPVPPLPADVPAPVAELILNMLAKPPEERPQSARWVADRARQLRSALPHSTGPEAQLDPELNEAVLAETALDGGGPVLPSAEAVTDPRLGASLTRADLGLSAESSPTPPGLPAEFGTGTSEASRRRKRSALLAALVSVAVAAIGGTVAAVMLSGKPMSTTGDVSPASSSVVAPNSGTVSQPASSSSSPSQLQGPAGVATIAPTLRGTGFGSGSAPTLEPTARKTTKPASKPTTAPPTTVAPTTPPPTTPTTGGGSPSEPANGPAGT